MDSLGRNMVHMLHFPCWGEGVLSATPHERERRKKYYTWILSDSACVFFSYDPMCPYYIAVINLSCEYNYNAESCECF